MVSYSACNAGVRAADGPMNRFKMPSLKAGELPPLSGMSMLLPVLSRMACKMM